MVVLHKDSGDAYYAALGDKLYQHDTIITLDNSRCRLRFINADVIAMAPKTKISIDELIDDRKERKKKSAINMFYGKAMFYIVKLLRHKKVEAKVKTSTAICGLRGTRFSVEIYKGKKKSAQGSLIYVADTRGYPDVLSDAGILYLADSGGDTVYTVVNVFEGSVEICNASGNCLTLTKGESGWVDEDGNLWSGPMDPEVSDTFILDTTGGDEGDVDDIVPGLNQPNKGGSGGGGRGPQ